MATARQIITAALRKLASTSSNSAPTAEDMQIGLDALNSLIDSKSTTFLNIHTITPYRFPLTPGKLNYTLGPTGDWQTERPMRLETAKLMLNPIIVQPPPPSCVPIMLDTFTGVAGPLSAHVGELGAIWQSQPVPYWESGSDLIGYEIDGNGNLITTMSNPGSIAPSGALVLSDTQTIEIYFTYTDGNGPYMGFLGSANESYMMNWLVNSNNSLFEIDFYRQQGGNTDSIGYFVSEYSPFVEHRLLIQVTPEEKKVYLDGINVLNITDSAITTGAVWMSLYDCFETFTVSKVEVKPCIEAMPCQPLLYDTFEYNNSSPYLWRYPEQSHLSNNLVYWQGYNLDGTIPTAYSSYPATVDETPVLPSAGYMLGFDGYDGLYYSPLGIEMPEGDLRIRFKTTLGGTAGQLLISFSSDMTGSLFEFAKRDEWSLIYTLGGSGIPGFDGLVLKANAADSVPNTPGPEYYVTFPIFQTYGSSGLRQFDIRLGATGTKVYIDGVLYIDNSLPVNVSGKTLKLRSTGSTSGVQVLMDQLIVQEATCNWNPPAA